VVIVTGSGLTSGVGTESSAKVVALIERQSNVTKIRYMNFFIGDCPPEIQIFQVILP
jgi:hypothetical protein